MVCHFVLALTWIAMADVRASLPQSPACSPPRKLAKMGSRPDDTVGPTSPQAALTDAPDPQRNYSKLSRLLAQLDMGRFVEVMTVHSGTLQSCCTRKLKCCTALSSVGDQGRARGKGEMVGPSMHCGWILQILSHAQVTYEECYNVSYG